MLPTFTDCYADIWKPTAYDPAETPGQENGILSETFRKMPCVRRSGGDFILLKDPHGLVLGAMGKTEYRSYEIQLEPGDTIFLYTDGLTEAENVRHELFGEERMTDHIASFKGTPKEVIDHLVGAVQQFVGDTEQSDDLTMLAIQWKNG